jgi:ABC-type multidrug transport system ATPase subunit
MVMAIDAIMAENLTYQYGDLVAVDHISFSVGEGEVESVISVIQYNSLSTTRS